MSKPVVGQCVNSLCTAYGQMVADEHEHDDRRRNAIPVGHGRGVQGAEPEVWSEAAIEAAFTAAMHQLLRRELSQEEGREALASALVKVPEGKRAMLDALAGAGVLWDTCHRCEGMGYALLANGDTGPCPKGCARGVIVTGVE